MKNQKGSVLVVVVITILSLAVVGLGGFVVYDKVIKKDNIVEEKNANKKEKTSSEEILWENSNEVQKLYKMVKYPGDALVNNWYFYKNNAVSIDTLDNTAKLWMAYTQLDEDDINKDKISVYGEEVDGLYIDIDKLEDAMLKVFGEKVAYEKKSFMPVYCDREFHYNEKNNRYEAYQGGCGGPIYEYVKTDLYKAIKKDNDIIIYEKFAVFNVEKLIEDNSSSTNAKTSGIYRDLGYKTLIKEFSSFGEANSIDFDIKDYYDQLSMVKYTFKKGNDNEYHFYSSEIVDELQ